jgi:hypothetical protein
MTKEQRNPPRAPLNRPGACALMEARRWWLGDPWWTRMGAATAAACAAAAPERSQSGALTATVLRLTRAQEPGDGRAQQQQLQPPPCQSQSAGPGAGPPSAPLRLTGAQAAGQQAQRQQAPPPPSPFPGLGAMAHVQQGRQEGQQQQRWVAVSGLCLLDIHGAGWLWLHYSLGPQQQAPGPLGQAELPVATR